ncbi:MAG: cytochrome c biogenesis protein CcsA [Gammaproteobacteria bacterium]|nr:cytochrome c biogenesis protein CcsA [Gammaproteobacteria bacterium]
MTSLSILAAILYVAASFRVAVCLYRQESDAGKIRHYLLPGFAGLICHFIVLYNGLRVGMDLNLGFFNAASLMCWVITLFLLIVNLKKPVENLAMLFLPFAAAFTVLAQLMPGQRITSGVFDLSLGLHILLSLAAYSLLTIAALQAVLLAIQEHQLRHKHVVQVLNILPPLKVMEDVLFGMIGTGFFCLSLSLVSGLMFIHDLFAQHLVHKTVLSLLAWVIFAILLWGRWSRGWRGVKAIRWTLGGFFTLMLAYFGSKLVLEIILDRV